LFSKDYIHQLKSLHNDKTRPQGFGGKVKKLGKFHFYMEKWKPDSLLDYGCGKGHILHNLKEKYPDVFIEGYDPAVQMFNKTSRLQYDCVFSNDVLEHVEPPMIDLVLSHIDKTATKYIWLRIDTLPARKKLPDGRNAHLIQQSGSWWTEKISNCMSGSIIYSETDKKGKFDVAIEKINTE